MWLAHDSTIGREVALKELRPEQASNPAVWSRFLREARITGQLEHPGIVPVYELGGPDGDRPPFYTMRFIKGRTLTEAARAYHQKRTSGQVGSLELRELLSAFVSVCNAVAYAHDRGVIHRDLKGQNVVLGDFGEVIVLDWGLARNVRQLESGSVRAQESVACAPALSLSHSLTEQGQIVGTPAYMAPEQAAGDTELDARSDVYGLGAMLYEILTGRPPFAGEDAQDVLRKVRDDEPRPPHDVWRETPRALEAVCRKAMSKVPQQRYASAVELAREVQRWLADEPVRTFPEPWRTRAYRWLNHHRTLVAGAAAALIVTVISLAIATVLLGEANAGERHMRTLAQFQERLAGEQRDLAEKQKQQADFHMRQAQGAEGQAKENLWQSYLEQARGHRFSGRPGQRFKSLQAIRNAAAMRPAPELRDEALACLALVDLQFVKLSRTQNGAETGYHVFDPNLARLAVSDSQGRIDIHDVAGRQESFVLPNPVEGTSAQNLRFSPDGRILAAAYVRGGEATWTVFFWNLETRQTLFSARTRSWSVMYDFSPDSRQVAIPGADGAVVLVSLHEKKASRQLATDFRDGHVGFSADGTRLAVPLAPSAQGWTPVQIIEVASGKVLGQVWSSGPVNALAWHPHDPDLLATSPRWGISVWDVRTGRLRTQLYGHSAEVTDLAFNHRGNILASTGWDGTVRLWCPWTSRQLLSASGAVVNCKLQFSPDDRRLALGFDGEHYGWWEVAGGTEHRSLAGFTGPGEGTHLGGGVHAGGRLLAMALADIPQGGVRFWDLADGRQLGFLPLGQTNRLVFDPVSGAMISSGNAGVQVWPVRSDAHDVHTVRVGPARNLALNGPHGALSITPDGRRLAAMTHWSGQVTVLNLGGLVDGPGLLFPGPWVGPLVVPRFRPDHPVARVTHPGAQRLSLNPDGRWLATSTWKGKGIKVWDIDAAKLVHEWPDEGDANVLFSPDGKWLAIRNTRECRIHETGSWRLVHQLECTGDHSAMSFDPDSRILAFTTAPATVRLVEPSSGQTLAVLDEPFQSSLEYLGFSPDGSQLVTCTTKTRVIRVWDLHALRHNVRPLGLDWSNEPLRSRPRTDLKPLRLHIEAARASAPPGNN